MRTVFRSCSTARYRLTSVCLRYALAIASVWLRSRPCNLLGLNDFGFDYPLNLNWFLCSDLSIVGLLGTRLSLRTLARLIERCFLPEYLFGVSDSLLNDEASLCRRPETVPRSTRLHQFAARSSCWWTQGIECVGCIITAVRLVWNSRVSTILCTACHGRVGPRNRADNAHSAPTLVRGCKETFRRKEQRGVDHGPQ